MIHEWSYSYFHSKEMNDEQINEAFGFLLNSEIGHILNGETIFTLKRILEEKENPYHPEEILMHLAIYAINLILLRTIICRDKYLFQINHETWNKLIYLWKYAFSEDTLSDYSNLFRAEAKGAGYLMLYSGSSKNKTIEQDRLTKLADIHLALGDETTLGIITSLLGTNNSNQIVKILSQNHLNAKAQYWWNYLLKNFTFREFRQEELFHMLSGFYEVCLDEQDNQYLFAFYLLLHFLLRNNEIKVENNTNEVILNYVIDGITEPDYNTAATLQPYSERTLIFYIKKLAIDLLDYAVLNKEHIREIFKHCSFWHFYRKYGYEYDIYYTTGLYDQILQKIIANNKNCIPFGDTETTEYITMFLQQTTYDANHKKLNSWRLLSNYFEIAYHLSLLGEHQESITIFRTFIGTFEADNFNHVPRIPIAQKIHMIDYLCQMYQKSFLARHIPV